MPCCLPDGTGLSRPTSPAAAIAAAPIELGIRAETCRDRRRRRARVVDVMERLGERTLIYADLRDGTPVVYETSPATVRLDVGQIPSRCLPPAVRPFLRRRRQGLPVARAGRRPPVADVAAGASRPRQRVALARPSAGRTPLLLNRCSCCPISSSFLVLLFVPLGLGIWLSSRTTTCWVAMAAAWGSTISRDLLTTRSSGRHVRNTFVFVLLTMPAFVGLGLFLALALNDSYRRSAVLRAIFFGSSVLSVTIVTLIWRLVTCRTAVLAAERPRPGRLHGFTDRQRDLGAAGIAMVTVWWIIGLPMTLFLAALQQIPAELYEAAALDHASRLRRCGTSPLPSIRRTIAVVAVIEIVLQFQLFGQIAADHRWRAQQPLAPDRACSSTKPGSATSAGFRGRRLAGAVRPHAAGRARADVDLRVEARIEHGKLAPADVRWATGCCCWPWCCWQSPGLRRSSGWSG